MAWPRRANCQASSAEDESLCPRVCIDSPLPVRIKCASTGAPSAHHPAHQVPTIWTTTQGYQVTGTLGSGDALPNSGGLNEKRLVNYSRNPRDILTERFVKSPNERRIEFVLREQFGRRGTVIQAIVARWAHREDFFAQRARYLLLLDYHFMSMTTIQFQHP